jgi:hypothetical protein
LDYGGEPGFWQALNAEAEQQGEAMVTAFREIGIIYHQTNHHQSRTSGKIVNGFGFD